MKKIAFVPALLGALLLSACQLGPTSSDLIDSTIDPSSSIGSSDSATVPDSSSGSGPVSPDSSSNPTSSSQGPVGANSYHRNESYRFNLKDANVSMGYDSLDTTGNQKILVVPIKLTDGPAWTSTMLDRIEKAFFGEASDTYWESVTSYFDKASYGTLKLSGEVLDPVSLSYSISYLNDQDSEGYDVVDSYISPAFYQQASASKLQEYDLDRNGHVDATVFIYSNNEEYRTAFWGSVWYPDTIPNIEKPTIATRMWASYNFSTDAGNNVIDAHTYIHEMGHMLGLDDYYNYDGSWDPVGMLEMQSYNVGDQGMTSKIMNEWVQPYVLDEVSTYVDIEIRTSALYPDAILIQDDWNGTPLDEYLLIEYYTPLGNNENDSKKAYYNDSRYKMYTKSGLRIYHVDARLAKLDFDAREPFQGYSDEILDDGYIYFTGASNSVSWSYLKEADKDKYKLNHLMQANVTSSSSRNHLQNGATLSDSNCPLYQLNDTFQASSVFFQNGTRFNDGSEVGYSITMIAENTTSHTATVRITKI